MYVLWCRIYRLCGLTKYKSYDIICVLNEKEIKMNYMGSKNRLSKELVPIIQSYIDNLNIQQQNDRTTGKNNFRFKIG